MSENSSNKKPEVNLGKAAIFLGVIAVLGIVAASSGVWFYGFIGVLAGIGAIGVGAMWLLTRRAVNKSASRD